MDKIQMVDLRRQLDPIKEEIDLAIQLCDKMIVMTEHEVISGSPRALIEKGTFENLFPDDMIVFDNKTKNFRVKK